MKIINILKEKNTLRKFKTLKKYLKIGGKGGRITHLTIEKLSKKMNMIFPSMEKIEARKLFSGENCKFQLG